MEHECDKCDKKFGNKEALEQHKKDKHIAPVHKKPVNKKYIYAGVVVLIIVAAAAFMFVSGPSSYNVKSPDEDIVIGSAYAPVTMIEFSDFQCPFCAKFMLDTYDDIKEEYVNTGKVKFIYKHYPLPSHNNARKAAQASECALDIGGIDAFEGISYKMSQNNNFLSESNLLKFGSEFVNATEFEACLKSGAMADRVENDLQEGRRLGVTSTPTFFIDGQKLEGAQPFSAFQTIIESKLNAAQE